MRCNENLIHKVCARVYHLLQVVWTLSEAAETLQDFCHLLPEIFYESLMTRYQNPTDLVGENSAWI